MLLAYTTPWVNQSTPRTSIQIVGRYSISAVMLRVNPDFLIVRAMAFEAN